MRYTARRAESGDGVTLSAASDSPSLDGQGGEEGTVAEGPATPAVAVANTAARIINPTVLHFLLGLSAVTQVCFSIIPISFFFFLSFFLS